MKVRDRLNSHELRSIITMKRKSVFPLSVLCVKTERLWRLPKFTTEKCHERVNLMSAMSVLTCVQHGHKELNRILFKTLKQ